MQALKVWVAYATAEQQWLIALPYTQGMTAKDALKASGLAQQTTLPEPLQLGVFGQKILDLDATLQAGDRLEIYRALSINPKEIRRLRADKNPVGRYVRRLRQSRAKPNVD